jgi:hypothetical protein
MGQSEQARTGGRWPVAPDVDQLKAAAEVWQRNPTKDGPSNHRFLDLFAVYLVKHVRAEELRLQRSADPGLSWQRREHRRLVGRIRDLMGDGALGLDVTEGIQGFLEAWGLHLVATSLRGPVAPDLGH